MRTTAPPAATCCIRPRCPGAGCSAPVPLPQTLTERERKAAVLAVLPRSIRTPDIPDRAGAGGPGPR